jgi:hypothetical protein
MYGIYILFVFVILSIVVLSSVAQEPLPMNVFIRDMACPNDLGTITLQSWDYNDYPLPGVSLDVTGIGSFLTDGDGKWAMENLSNGTYHVSASKPGYEQKSFNFTISCPIKKVMVRPQTNSS